MTTKTDVISDSKTLRLKTPPIVRAIPVPTRDPLTFLFSISRKHPSLPIFRLKTGVLDAHLVNSPELIKEILLNKHRSFVKGNFLQNTKKVFGEGLLTSEGEFHHRQRQLIQPAFHHERISAYATIMTSYAERLMSKWKDGQTIEINSEMNRLTMAIVAKCLFDKDIEEETKEIASALSTTIEYFDRLSSPIARLYEKLPSNQKYLRATQKIDRFVYGIIEERRKEKKDTGDLLSMLLAARDEKGVMSDKQVRDEVLILFAAGHETTANALTWTWYLLSKNPDIEKRFHEEIDTVLGAKNAHTFEDYSKLTYTKQVLSESMRIYPPAWVIPRRAAEDVNIGGYFIPKDSEILISQYVLHHDPKIFTDPEKFEPERWTQELSSKLPKYSYFPFGAGPRSCIGEPFAWMEGVLLLATIGRNWEMIQLRSTQVGLSPHITLRPKNGIQMKISQRWR